MLNENDFLDFEFDEILLYVANITDPSEKIELNPKVIFNYDI